MKPTANSPFFSIIIPTFNRAHLLVRAIESVVGQTYSGWELLVIDDGSTDETERVVREFEDTRIHYFYKSNGGESSARNYGLSRAAGQYICLLDSDDYYYPEHLEVCYRAIAGQDFPTAVFRTGMVYEGQGSQRQTPFFQPESGIHPIQFFALNFCGVNSLCLHRKIFEKHLFDPSFVLFPDTHFLLRVLAEFPFHQIPARTSVYCIHDNQVSQTMYSGPETAKLVRNNIAAIRDVFDSYGHLANPLVPAWLKDYLICQKYLHHANGALLYRKFALAVSYFRQSVRHNKKCWFAGFYVKFILKLPLKLLFDYPRAPT